MARLESTRTNDRTPTLSAALYGRWRGQPPRGARALSWRHALPHPRHEPAVDHRDLRIFGLHPTHKRRHYGPLQASKGRHARGGAPVRAADDCGSAGRLAKGDVRGYAVWRTFGFRHAEEEIQT